MLADATSKNILGGDRVALAFRVLCRMIHFKIVKFHSHKQTAVRTSSWIWCSATWAFWGKKNQNYPCVSSRLLVPESKKNNVTLRAHYCAQSESTSKRLHKDTVTTVGGVDLALRARVVIQSTIDDKRIL